jgi:riboflavin synthase
MFTGIVSSVGRVAAVTLTNGMHEIVIDTGGLETSRWRIGDSICVAGVCLTATRIEAGHFAACASGETLGRTKLGSLAPGAGVNLEPALAAGDPLGGHYVTGHVDGVASVITAREEAGSRRLSIEAPLPLARYLAPRGSAAIDGVSLTISSAAGNRFEVNLVPHTLRVTTLGTLAAGDAVNLEVDLLARYLAQLCDAQWRE